VDTKKRLEVNGSVFWTKGGNNAVREKTRTLPLQCAPRGTRRPSKRRKTFGTIINLRREAKFAPGFLIKSRTRDFYRWETMDARIRCCGREGPSKNPLTKRRGGNAWQRFSDLLENWKGDRGREASIFKLGP